MMLHEHPDKRVHFEDPCDESPEGAVCGTSLEAEDHPTQVSAGSFFTHRVELVTCTACLWHIGPDALRRIALDIEIAVAKLRDDGSKTTSTGWDRLASAVKRLRQTEPRGLAGGLLNVCGGCQGSGRRDSRGVCRRCVRPFIEDSDYKRKERRG